MATHTTLGDTTTAALPVGALTALATVVFIGCVTETMPAGVLLGVSDDLAITEAQAGHLVSVYAISTALTAIPLTAATRHLPRRTLLLGLILGFALVNTVTALSPWYPLTLAARIAAGAVSGVLWAMIAGYAMRLVDPDRAGRALAIAMLGTPLGFAVGVPAASLLGDLLGWRYAFGTVAAITLLLIGAVLWQVPQLPGQSPQPRTDTPRRTIRGLPAVLATTFVLVLGHNILYTYIGPTIAAAQRPDLIAAALLVFGAASVLGIAIVAALVDRWLRTLMLTATLLIAAAATTIATTADQPWLLFTAIAIWGAAFGGTPTMLPAAAATIAGPHGDIAQSMTITVWNIAIAGGAITGGALLDATHDTRTLPLTTALLALTACAIIRTARRHGFPHRTTA
ncbi:MFS transporter [Nocardia sp. NPDC050406]|uniref:MFS transporter n=1 Tax=Nocardia sp. NPDC050406 TaxID=3364318 RepID=UPI00379B438F